MASYALNKDSPESHKDRGLFAFSLPKVGDPAAQTIAHRREATYPQGLGTEHD